MRRGTKIRIRDLQKAGEAVLGLSNQVSWSRQKEQWLHGVLLGYLEARFGHMQTEFHPWEGDLRRVDFRHSVTNPVLIELVVMRHGGEQSRKMNDPELRKLASIPHSRAKSRYLLILDRFSARPMNGSRFKARYSGQGVWRGRPPHGRWSPVRVIYVHPKGTFSFAWPPRARP